MERPRLQSLAITQPRIGGLPMLMTLSASMKLPLMTILTSNTQPFGQLQII